MSSPERPPAPFIVGTSRSGTTLLRLMLDANPLIAIPPETHFITRALDVARDLDPGSRVFHAIVSNPRWPEFGLSDTELQERIDGIEPLDLGEMIRAFYLLYAQRFGKPRWGDKTPAYLQHMPAIAEILPEAHFVHLIRDGRDVACSIVPLSWGPDSVEEAARWWAERITAARAAASSLQSYSEVRYEEMVADTEGTLKTLCSYLSLPFSEQMMQHDRTAPERLAEIERDLVDETGRVIASASERAEMHRLARQPALSDQVGRWRRELSRSDVRAFEAIAGSALVESGYDLAGPVSNRSGSG